MYFLDYCEDLWPIISIIKNGLIPIVQIGVPIILIVLGILDLGKAMVASKEDEIKKAQGMLVKRAIYAVAIFFVVTIVTLVFGLFDKPGVEKVEGAGSWSTCWKCNGQVNADGTCK